MWQKRIRGIVDLERRKAERREEKVRLKRRLMRQSGEIEK